MMEHVAVDERGPKISKDLWNVFSTFSVSF